MSASNTASSTRRRLSLLTGSSLAAALVMAGVGGITLAPTAALAANECTPVSPTLATPGDNGATADTYLCNGSYPAISYTNNGALTLQLQNNVTTTTGGLVVTGGDAAAITISRVADSPADSGDLSLTSTSGAGLQVTRATGGTISVNLTDNDTTDTPLVISGTTYGVRLSNAGTGSTTFTTSNGTISGSAGPGIEMTTDGTGALTLNNGSTTTGTTSGARLRNIALGAGAVSATNSGSLTATAGVGLEIGTAGTGNVTVTNNGSITGTTASVLVTGGTNATVTNNAGWVMNGLVTLNNTGVATLTNGGEWNTTGTSFLGAGNTTLTNAVLGRIRTNEGGAATALDFGAGTNTFAHFGQLAVGSGTEGAATLTLTGLTTWNNSGTVLFGFHDINGTSDGVANDRIVAAGTVFTGITTPEVIGGTRFSVSQLMMDVDFSADQDDCAAAVSGDCLDLRASSTAGTTDVIVTVAGVGPAERVVLIDVAGAGTSAAEHFTLSEASNTYHAVGEGGVVEGGLFLYELQYDETAKQHALVATAVGGRGLEVARIGRAASEPWRTATGMWHDRQADLRNSIVGRAEGYAPGAWLKIAGGFIDENRIDTLAVGADTLEFSTTYDQRTTALVGGVDLFRFIGENNAWVLGVTAGKVESKVDFADVRSAVDLDGHSFGAYASVLSGPAFFDVILNATNLDLTHSGFGAEFESAAKSFGYQLEGGYRLFRVNEDGPWIEPLASVSYVRTEVDDLVMSDVTTSFEDTGSLRAALGLRLGGDLVMDALTTSFSATGRLWREFDGDSASTISAAFGDTELLDVGMDNLGDLGVAMSVFTLGGRLSAHLAYNMLFREDYQNTAASFGLRYNW